MLLKKCGKVNLLESYLEMTCSKTVFTFLVSDRLVWKNFRGHESCKELHLWLHHAKTRDLGTKSNTDIEAKSHNWYLRRCDFALITSDVSVFRCTPNSLQLQYLSACPDSLPCIFSRALNPFKSLFILKKCLNPPFQFPFYLPLSLFIFHASLPSSPCRLCDM